MLNLKFKVWLALGLSFLLLNNFQAYASPRSSASKGIDHYNSEEFDKALTEFLAGLEKDPNNSSLKYDLGTALYRLQQFPQAAEAFKKAAEKDPKLAADGWFNLGNAMFEAQKFDDAVKAYKNSLKLNSADKDAKHNLELALRAKQMQQQQKQQQNQNGQDSTGNKKDQQQQEQAEEQEEQKQEQQQSGEQEQANSADADTTGQQPQPAEKQDGPMSKEEALQLLQALESDEQEAQKEKLIRQFGEPKKVQKDW